MFSPSVNKQPAGGDFELLDEEAKQKMIEQEREHKRKNQIQKQVTLRKE